VVRWLLDQNFPKPRFDADQLDNTVEYIHLFDFDPALSNTSTPDWMLHLAAEAGGFDGVITTDPTQFEQDEEAVALACTALTVVTWRSRINDPVVQWGSVLAFMPAILRVMEEQGPSLIMLPVPRLDRSQFEKTAGIGGRIASQRRRSLPELRALVLPDMLDELAERRRQDLIPIIQRERRPKRR
jgi:hypothetical protein